MQSRGKGVNNTLPAFLPDTADVRASDWQVASAATFNVSEAERLSGLESFIEARQWAAQSQGDAGVVLLVDTVRATFQLDEMLFELREQPVAVQPSIWGYLFSFIKTFSEHPECVLPDRADITISTHCVRSYARHVSNTGRRRGAVVLGEQPPGENSLFADDAGIVAADLLQVPRGRITEQGIRSNIERVLQPLAELFSGRGDNAETDVASVEFARAQLWQWVHHETGVLDSGQIITLTMVEGLLADELARLLDTGLGEGRYAEGLDLAAKLLLEMTRDEEIAPFLMAEAYRHVD